MEDASGEQKDYVAFHTSDNHPITGDDLQMKGFLERPVQIAALSISLDSDVDLAFNIWNLFLEDPVVRSKLRNYAFLRTDMKVRIAVSGTPFHYGRLLVSYQPFPTMNPYLSSFGPTFRQERLRYLSQAPGAKTMDVRENTPIEMHIPYVSPLPVGRLYNDSNLVMAASDPFDDFTGLGTLYISTLNQIKAVATTATNVFIYIYAMADSPVIHGSTGSVTQITAESDERINGPVYSMASGALKISKVLEQVPIISTFAKASSIGLSALKSMASLFGWSYPTLVGTPVRMRPDPFQNGAQTTGIDTGKRITLDPLQELHVDPRICAVDEDELVIASIASREGLFDQFEWAPSDTSLSDVIWQSVVTPRANKSFTNVNEYIVPTPLSFAATPFRYWRGKIKYRFEIVASNFHRGKLMFAYEPNVRQFSLITAALNVNKQYVKVIDIQETQSVEFEVDWNFPRSYCKNIPNSTIGNTVGSQYTDSAEFAECANGIIFVTPFTQIQSPDGSAIQINVFVSGAQMVFNRLTDEYLPSGVNPIAESDHDSVREFSTMGMNKNLSEVDDISSHFFGETPVSFRALLKRFTTSVFKETENGAGYNENWSLRGPVYPITQVESTYNFTARNLYFYLRRAFLGMRGGMRRRIWFRSEQSNFDCAAMISLLHVSDSYSDYTLSSVTGSAESRTCTYANEDGTVIFVRITNAGIEFELPCYTNNLFLWSINSDPWNSTLSVMDPAGTKEYIVNIVPQGIHEFFDVTEHFAAAEDFTLFRWISANPQIIGTPI
jgi:hypothetical protein